VCLICGQQLPRIKLIAAKTEAKAKVFIFRSSVELLPGGGQDHSGGLKRVDFSGSGK
jgi:hypothetical protein